MKRYRHYIIVAIILSALFFTVYQAVTEDARVSKSLESDPETGLDIGSKAPDFTLQGYDGEAISLSAIDKPVMLNFWASWCPPCKAEMPHMKNFYEKNKDEVEIVAVNMMHQESSEQDMMKFYKEYGLNFPVPIDEDGMVSTTYQVVSIPTSYFIDSEGIIVSKYTGPMTETSISETFKRIK